MKTLKVCLVILCLLHVRAVGLPRFNGANSFMDLKLNTRKEVYTVIDDEDFELVSKYKWYLSGGRGDRRYVISPKKTGGQINLHRLVMGNPKGIVDHRDHNVLNNQKSNLRVCSFTDNIRNSRKIKECFSIYKGLVYNKSVCRWRAKLYAGKTIELGYFERECDAALAYNEAAIKYHGEFACLNVVEKIHMPTNLVRKRFELIYNDRA